jgi:hypothetical protein
LRYFGNDRWGFAFYTYSNEKYELSTYLSHLEIAILGNIG